jgi:hypothetical protein
MEKSLAVGAGCFIGIGWLGAHVAYARASSQFKSDRLLFESLMQRYRNGNFYTQLRLRGIEFDPDQKNNRPPPAPAQDILRDSHMAMTASFEAQARWVKAIQRIRRQKPPSAAACDLDDQWLRNARQRLYSTPSQPPP